jgi:hypothetical protein
VADVGIAHAIHSASWWVHSCRLSHTHTHTLPTFMANCSGGELQSHPPPGSAASSPATPLPFCRIASRSVARRSIVGGCAAIMAQQGVQKLWHLFNFFWNSVWNRPMQRSYTVESGAMFECLSMPQVDAFARLTSKWVWPLCIAMTHGHYALRKGRVLKRSSNFLSLSSERRDKRAFARTSRTYSVTLWKQYRQQTRCTSNAQVK